MNSRERRKAKRAAERQAKQRRNKQRLIALMFTGLAIAGVLLYRIV